MSEGEETKGLAFTTVCWPIASRDGSVRSNKTKYSGNQAKDSSRPVRTCEVIENFRSFNRHFILNMKVDPRFFFKRIIYIHCIYI